MIEQIDLKDIIAVAATLFFIMDPLGNIPTFQAILKNFETKQRVKIILRELIFALVILLVFLVAGTYILGFLGLTQPSLNIAGGILLFIIAIKMVFPSGENFKDKQYDDPYIVPLAIPLIAGPSTIAVLLLLSSSQPNRIFEWIIALLIAWILATVILVLSPFIMSFFGGRGLKAIETLMGMLLILIAIQMFLNGLSLYLKQHF